MLSHGRLCTYNTTPCTRVPPPVLLRFALLLALTSAPLLAQQNDSILKRVDDHYKPPQLPASARYTEHYTGMGVDRTESGTLRLQKARPHALESYADPPG